MAKGRKRTSRVKKAPTSTKKLVKEWTKNDTPEQTQSEEEEEEEEEVCSEASDKTIPVKSPPWVLKSKFIHI